MQHQRAVPDEAVAADRRAAAGRTRGPERHCAARESGMEQRAHHSTWFTEIDGWRSLRMP
jgi:hypothetical protein